MHIGFRTSGGRGEYEIVGGHAGIPASSLEGWRFFFRWPDGAVRDTLLTLNPGQSGKPRLRSQATAKFQVGRIVAAMLLLPPPVRDMDSVAATLPILREKEYLVTKIGFGPETELSEIPELATVDPNYVEIANAVHTDYINVAARWARIANVLHSTDHFPPGVVSALNDYRAFLLSSNPANSSLERIGDALRHSVAISDASYAETSDPLPTLERLAGIAVPDEPSLPPPNELSDDEIEVKARSAEIYRLARVRGTSARRFSIDVRTAYGERCAFCGAKFGGVEGIPSGIDAAHILAWGAYDLDVVSNGIALCKNHHWAFDAALMAPVIEHDRHVVRFTRRREYFESDALRILGSDGFVIPEDWLPEDPNQRPSARYLRRLYDDLAITF